MTLAAGAVVVASEKAQKDEIRVFNNLEKNKNANGPKFVQDEIIVKFKNDNKPFRVLKVPYGQVKEKVKEYKDKKEVEFVEPNYIAKSYIAPNDPLYPYQWHFDNINMEAAWDLASGTGITVAVIDTGITQGPDLANTCFEGGYDFVNGDGDASDDNAHGTHVAGTIAQRTNNGVGVAGVAYNACLMPIKVLDSGGSGTYADIIAGIYYAADNGAHVINMSLGGSYDSYLMEEAVDYAYNKDVVIVAAAGNDYRQKIGYPASYKNVIAVGATRFDDTKAAYSNYGRDLDIVAPGGDMNVDQNGDGYGDGILQNTFDPDTGDFGYWFFNGTSMASPHVAGVAALILSLDPNLRPIEVRSILESSALDLGATGWDRYYGHGLLDAEEALNMVNSSPDPDPEPEPESYCGDGVCNRPEERKKTCPEDCA